jgi:transposase
VQRYTRRVEEYRLPRAKEARAAFANQIGEDGFALLDALNHAQASMALRERPMVQHLKLAWAQHFERIDGVAQWRAGQSLPPTSQRFASPYDVDAK